METCSPNLKRMSWKSSVVSLDIAYNVMLLHLSPPPRHRPLVAPTPYGPMIAAARLDLLRLSTSAVLLA